MKDVSTN